MVYEKEDDLMIIFNYFKPDIRFLGSDYGHGKRITQPDAIPIKYIDSLDIHTSTIRSKL